jgi:hypothetical protein
LDVELHERLGGSKQEEGVVARQEEQRMQGRWDGFEAEPEEGPKAEPEEGTAPLPKTARSLPSFVEGSP